MFLVVRVHDRKKSNSGDWLAELSKIKPKLLSKHLF